MAAAGHEEERTRGAGTGAGCGSPPIGEEKP